MEDRRLRCVVWGWLGGTSLTKGTPDIVVYTVAMWILLFVACQSNPPDPVSEVPTEGSLRLLTYNVAGLPDGLSSADGDGIDRMTQIRPLLNDFDVVGLQEDFIEENHVIVTDTTHDTVKWFDSLNDWGKPFLGSGLSMLSRDLVVVDYFEEHYTACHGVLDGASDCLASKGFQVLRVQVGEHEIDLYNTHHEAGGGAEDDAARSTQVDQVLPALGQLAGRAVLFMGDSNLRWSDPEDADDLQRYADIGLIDACDATNCPEGDHIDRFHRAPRMWPWRYRLVARHHLCGQRRRRLSDHPAIGVTLSWSTLKRFDRVGVGKGAQVSVCLRMRG